MLQHTMRHLAFIALIVAAPIVVSAQSFAYFRTLVTEAGSVIGVAVPVIIALGVLLFIWGLVVFIYNSGNEAELAVGKSRMVWGVVILFVAVSLWGLVLLLQQLFGVDGDIGTIVAPELPG